MTSISDLAGDETEEATVPLEETASDTETPVEDSPSQSVSPATPEPQDDFLTALLDKIQPVNTIRKNLKILIYSEPGVGKTVVMGSAPENFIIDVEDGLISLANHPDLVKSSVQTWRYSNFTAMEAIVDKFKQKPAALAHFKTLSVDSVSELHKRGLAEITERDWRLSPLVNNRYKASTDQQVENNEHIRRLVSSLRDLDMNLILTAHARTIEPKNMPFKTFPDFSEKLANVLAGIVDIVAYYYWKDVEGQKVRALRLQGTDNIIAKTRIGGYPEELIEPTWDDIYNVFMEAQRKAAE